MNSLAVRADYVIVGVGVSRENWPSRWEISIWQWFGVDFAHFGVKIGKAVGGGGGGGGGYVSFLQLHEEFSTCSQLSVKNYEYLFEKCCCIYIRNMFCYVI